MKTILKLLTIFSLKSTIECLCGTKPLLNHSIYFKKKERKVIHDYFGFSADNGNRYSIWGWVRFAEVPKGNVEILRYSMKKDFDDDQMIPLSDRMLEVEYIGAKKSFQISIMDDGANPIVKSGELITEPGYWVFVGVSANYEDGIAHLFAKRYDTNKNISFVTALNYNILQLKNTYEFSLGAFTNSSIKTNGMNGEMTHWYIGLFDFENVHLLWTSTYDNKDLKAHNYINTYYMFDEYKRKIDIKSKSKSYSNLVGKFVNKVNYKFKQGVQIFPKGAINIKGNLTIKSTFVQSMSILVGIDLRKIVLAKRITLFRRGPFRAKLNGIFEVFATRKTVASRWKLSVKYFYSDAGKTEIKKRVFTSNLFFSGAYSTVQATITVGPHNMVSIGMYLDGMVEFFEDQPYTVFKMNAFERQNQILNPEIDNWDYSTIYFFAVIESAGNLIFPLLNFRQNIADCAKGCALTTDFIDKSFGCMECKLKDNNVRDYNSLKCLPKCDIGYKALHRNCVHCEQDDCSDTDGPKITIRPLNQIKTYFLIRFNKKLAQNNVSWVNNTKVTIEPDFLSTEYDYKLKVIGKDKMSLLINSKRDRKNQNLTISLIDKSKVYDLEGNKMHIAIAHYPLEYVDYYSKFEKDMVAFLSNLLIIIFLGTVGLTLLINLFSYCLKMEPLTSRIITLFHAFQYNTLLYFLNISFPHNCSDFLERTYKGLVIMSKWVETMITSFCYMDNGYEESLSITTPEKFQEQGIRFAFLFNTSLPLLFQILIIVYYILIKLVNEIPMSKKNPFKKFIKIQLRKLEYTAFIAAFMMFDLQLVVYSALNISLPVTTHYVYIASLSASWVYFFGLPFMALCLLYFLRDKKWRHLAKSSHRKKYKQKYGLLFNSFIPKEKGPMPYRGWYSIVLLRHFVFGCVIVFCYKKPLVQCSFCFFTTLTYLLLVYFCKPHTSNFEWIVECSNELMLTCNNFIYFILAWNEQYVFLKTSSRTYLGWIIIIFNFASVSIKSFFVFFPIFIAVMTLFFGGAISQIKKGINHIKDAASRISHSKSNSQVPNLGDGEGRLETEERGLKDNENKEIPEKVDEELKGDESYKKSQILVTKKPAELRIPLEDEGEADLKSVELSKRNLDELMKNNSIVVDGQNGVLGKEDSIIEGVDLKKEGRGKDNEDKKEGNEDPKNNKKNLIQKKTRNDQQKSEIEEKSGVERNS